MFVQYNQQGKGKPLLTCESRTFLNTELLSVLSDDHSECEPPDPISNSEVKPLSADGSVGSPHVRVGHRQAFK